MVSRVATLGENGAGAILNPDYLTSFDVDTSATNCPGSRPGLVGLFRELYPCP